MLVAKVDPGDIRQLVDAFKSEGTFDKLRRKIFSTIAATESYQNVSSNAEEVVDELLNSSRSDLTMNTARDILRKKLSGLYSSQYGIMIAQGLDADETLCSLLEEIGHSVDSFLGLTKMELVKSLQLQHADENHQVCDMEIDSDCEESQQSTSTKDVPLSDIALPPATEPSTYSLAAVSSAPHVMVGQVPFNSNTLGPFQRNNSSAELACTDPTKEIITAKSKSLLTCAENANIETSFASYQAQRLVSKNFYSYSRATVSSKRYVASTMEFRARRRRRAFNDDFVYY